MVVVEDARSGARVELPADGRRLLRLAVHAQVPAVGLSARGLRVFVAADVLIRALEQGGVQVVPALADGSVSPERWRETARELVRFGIRLPAPGGGGAEVHVCPAGALPANPGVMVAVAAVLGDEQPVEASDWTDLRLALLAERFETPVKAGPMQLRQSGEALAGWRALVASWAQSQSRPVPASWQARIDQAARAVDAPGLLEVLRDAESAPDLADGARFEVFASVDRLLGVQLVRDVGRT